MNAAVYNISPRRNSDFFLGEPMRLKDSDMNPINLTGFTLLAQVYDLSGTIKLADFTIIMDDVVNGILRPKLPYTVTAALPNECLYDFLVIDPAGLRRYYLTGTCTPTLGITKP